MTRNEAKVRQRSCAFRSYLNSRLFFRILIKTFAGLSPPLMGFIFRLGDLVTVRFGFAFLHPILHG